jgi:hypothetical protein
MHSTSAVVGPESYVTGYCHLVVSSTEVATPPDSPFFPGRTRKHSARDVLCCAECGRQIGWAETAQKLFRGPTEQILGLIWRNNFITASGPGAIPQDNRLSCIRYFRILRLWR